jgi:hypothetical protein
MVGGWIYHELSTLSLVLLADSNLDLFRSRSFRDQHGKQTIKLDVMELSQGLSISAAVQFDSSLGLL